MIYMLDTNICIYIIKRKPQSVINKFKQCSINDVCISSITYAELEYVVSKSDFHHQNKIALIQFLSPIAILPFSDRAAVVYGDVRSRLEKAGTPIGPLDTLIAAHAISENLILATNNTKEFERVEDLQVENWVSSLLSAS